MSWVSGFVLYIMLWLVALFAVLPWGVRRNDDPQPGHDPGAPADPRLGRKLIWTTLVAAVLWVCAYAVIRSDLLPVRGY